VAIFGNEETVGISISDNGKGLQRENLGQIFDPFFSTRPDQVGFGLTFAKEWWRSREERSGSKANWGNGRQSRFFSKRATSASRRELISSEAMKMENG